MSKNNLYDILGVNKDASKYDIKKAYRNKAKKYHPDNKQGGSEEKMKELVKAYSILSSDDKRKYYDETGNEEPVNTFENRFHQFMASTFSIIVENENHIYSDLINVFKTKIRNTKSNMNDNIKKLQHDSKKITEVKSRLSTKKNTVLIDILNNKLESNAQSINHYKNEIEFVEQVLVVMEDYSYKFDEKPKRVEKNETFPGRVTFTFP